MSGLTIAWEYLTGYVVATDPSSRERAEWPPHPGRVFMALAAAWFETGEDHQEGQALRWLEALADRQTPELRLSPSDRESERSLVTVYVPINADDARGIPGAERSGKKITRHTRPVSLPLKRKHVERTFPRIHIGHAPCGLVWLSADGVEEYREALDHLCGKVTRIGHSSSLVRMWVAAEGDMPIPTNERWVADDAQADSQVRRISAGLLDMLGQCFNESAHERHAEIEARIVSSKEEKKKTTGKGSKERRAAIDAQIASLQEEAGQIDLRPTVRPALGLWTGYRRDGGATEPEYHHSHFDPDILVLVSNDGARFPLVSTLAVTRALRGAVMKHGIQPPPAWVSGHEPDGRPLNDEAGHLACVPLSFVGGEHADGHLLGLGLVFPRTVDRRERGRVLGPLLMDPHGKAKPVGLTLDRLGVWMLTKRDWTELRKTLQPETWTAFPGGADTWASVTPVVLDRFPKADRLKDRQGWTEEVAGIVTAACERIGLPAPVALDIDTTCWQRGGPRAITKRRPLRGKDGVPRDGDAALGDGFPPFAARGTNAPRPQVHVWLKFSEKVVGPVLLGAGRYLGYGFCRPLWEGRR